MNAIVTELISDANMLLEKVVAAQTGLPATITDPVLVKVEGAIESALGHLVKHPAVAAPAQNPS